MKELPYICPGLFTFYYFIFSFHSADVVWNFPHLFFLVRPTYMLGDLYKKVFVMFHLINTLGLMWKKYLLCPALQMFWDICEKRYLLCPALQILRDICKKRYLLCPKFIRKRDFL